MWPSTRNNRHLEMNKKKKSLEMDIHNMKRKKLRLCQQKQKKDPLSNLTVNKVLKTWAAVASTQLKHEQSTIEPK